MRWITFIILLYFMTSLHAARLFGWPRGNDAFPQILYLHILAIFYALYAAETSAPLAGFICGLCHDAFTPTLLIGTDAVPLALTALLVLRIRLSIFREHVISQFLITLLAVLCFGVLSVTMRRLIGAPLVADSIWTHFAHVAANALYTGLAAPFFFFLFFRLQPLLGFTSHGPRSRAHDSRR